VSNVEDVLLLLALPPAGAVDCWVKIFRAVATVVGDGVDRGSLSDDDDDDEVDGTGVRCSPAAAAGKSLIGDATAVVVIIVGAVVAATAMVVVVVVAAAV